MWFLSFRVFFFADIHTHWWAHRQASQNSWWALIAHKPPETHTSEAEIARKFLLLRHYKPDVAARNWRVEKSAFRVSEARLEAHQRTNQDDDSLTFLSPDSDFITIAWTNLRFSPARDLCSKSDNFNTSRGEPKHHTFSLAAISLQQVSSHRQRLWHGSLMKPSCRRCREWKEMSSVIGLNGLLCFRGVCEVISEGFESVLWLLMSEIDFCFVARDEWLLLWQLSIDEAQCWVKVENLDWKVCVCV